MVQVTEFDLLIRVLEASRRLGFLVCGNFALDKATVAACPIQID